jgi:hypothetical protein
MDALREEIRRVVRQELSDALPSTGDGLEKGVEP